MTGEAVKRLFDVVSPRFGDREGGYLRIMHSGWRQGDGGEKAFIELLGSEKVISAKREKQAERRAKKTEEARKAMEEAEAEAEQQKAAEGEGPEEK
jgi:large subunit ribosomal protein L17